MFQDEARFGRISDDARPSDSAATSQPGWLVRHVGIFPLIGATMTTTRPVNYPQTIPAVLRALGQVHETLNQIGLERKLHHLIQLRASQINRCDYCIKLHTNEARQDGETSERLDRLMVWEQVSDFSDKEKTALAWTEALTTLDRAIDLGALRARLRAYFSDEEIGALTSTVAMINLWNRIQISNH
jgi:AhpD family alkylhydroperoxidase